MHNMTEKMSNWLFHEGMLTHHLHTSKSTCKGPIHKATVVVVSGFIQEKTQMRSS